MTPISFDRVVVKLSRDITYEDALATDAQAGVIDHWNGEREMWHFAFQIGEK